MANQHQTAVLTVLLNGEQAQNEISKLESHAAGLKTQLETAKRTGNKALISGLENDLKQVNKTIRSLKTDVVDVTRILNNLSSAKPKELRATLNALNRQLQFSDLKRGSKGWNLLTENIRRVKLELKNISAESVVAESRMSRLSNTFNKYFGMATTAIATITGLSFAFRKLSEDVAKMDDHYADVMKTTGMTHDEVVDLNESFKKMDTRTAREQLNELARDAGKLGISGKKDVLDFVEAGNQINVALGEDLGEGAIKNIGKLTEVYRKSTKELDNLDLKGKMLAIGSAINELGQSSTASESYLVDFAQRLGGIGAQAGLSIQNILGYASALDQAGEKTEMSATAFQKLIMKIMSSPSEFAKIARVDVAKFNELIKTDMNQAITTVLKSLSDKGGLQQLIPIFKDMGLDAARAAEVVSSLANNIHLVTKAQEISNNAFSEGTSLTNEYSVKNNNLAAKLEKARKEFKDTALELGEKLNPVLLQSTNGITILIRTLAQLPKTYEENKAKILLIIAALTAYIYVVNAVNIVNKVQVFWNKAVEKSMISLYKTIAKHPYGLIAMALAAAIGYLIDYNRKAKESVDWYKKILSLYDDEKDKADKLFSSLKKTALGTQERKKAIDKINEVYGKYTGYMLDEKASLKDILTYQNLVNQALLKNAAIRARKEQLDTTGEETNKNVQETFNDVINKISKKFGAKIAGQAASELQGIISKIQENPNQETGESSFRQKYQTISYSAIDMTKDLNKIRAAVGKNMNEVYKIRQFFDTYIENLGGNIVDDTPVIENPSNNNDNNDSPYTPSGDDDKEAKKLAAKQKKELDLKLKTLETSRNEEIAKVKKYQEENQESEVDYRNKLLLKDAEYYGQKKAVLEDFLKQVSDPALKTEIEKQISEIEKKNSNAIIEQQKRIAQILLDADPVEKEKQAYDDRLREVGLFGKKKEEMTTEQLNVFELLEQQHLDNMSKITSKDASKRLKAIAEDQAKDESDFAEKHRQGLISESAYKEELLEIERKFLLEKLKIAGLSKEQIDDLNKKLYQNSSDTSDFKANERQSAESKYNLVDIDKFKANELKILADFEARGVITHDEAIKAKALIDDQYLGALTGKVGEASEKIQNVTSNLSSAYTSFQQADEMAVSRKYDKQIKAAKGNAKKQEKLEAEKEAALNDIRAEYADKQFIVTVAQVTATTAVTAMEAYKAMAGIPVVGPALGIAAAAAAIAAGAGQIAVAQQQKENAKQGYYTGGYTPHGPWDKYQGDVHSEEFVGNRFAVRNPAIKKVFDIVDQAQKNNTVSSLTEKDFARALDYREAENKYVVSGISNAISSGKNSEDSAIVLSSLSLWMQRNADVTERLNKRLDEPFVGEVPIVGKKGFLEGMKLYDKLQSNISRSKS